MPHKNNIWRKLKVLIWMKLIVPMMRAKSSPEIVSRGTMIGLIWAMTPLVGIQMYLTFMTWIVCKKLKWDFNLPVSIAWNWITNVVTLPFFYYAFYLTGECIMGNFSERVTFEKFCEAIRSILENSSMLDALKEMFAFLLKDMGIPMAIGSIPWMIISGWIGYTWTFKFIKKRLDNRLKRLENKQKRLENKLEKIDMKKNKLEEKLEKNEKAQDILKKNKQPDKEQ